MLRFMIILPVYTTRTKGTKKARSKAPLVQICRYQFQFHFQQPQLQPRYCCSSSDFDIISELFLHVFLCFCAAFALFRQR